MHVDTGHNFDEVIEFRDRTVKQFEVDLIVASVQESIDRGRRDVERVRRLAQHAADRHAARRHRRAPLRRRLRRARRDEERRGQRARSHRDEFGQWDPKNQRPELWDLYNTRHHRGEHLRVFPLSN